MRLNGAIGDAELAVDLECKAVETRASPEGRSQRGRRENENHRKAPEIGNLSVSQDTVRQAGNNQRKRVMAVVIMQKPSFVFSLINVAHSDLPDPGPAACCAVAGYRRVSGGEGPEVPASRRGQRGNHSP
ncbi:unnamed protein product [Arctogadus glacialis]